MNKLNIHQYTSFDQLPLEEYNQLKYSVYVIDHNWHYLFINDFVKNNLGERAYSIEGKKMWEVFPELNNDTVFLQMKQDAEHGKDINVITVSPLTGHRLHITGHRLADCFVFSSSILPRKEDLMHELRENLHK